MLVFTHIICNAHVRAYIQHIFIYFTHMKHSHTHTQYFCYIFYTWITVTHTHNTYVTYVTHMNHSHTECFVYTHSQNTYVSVHTHSTQCSCIHIHTTHMLHISHIWITSHIHATYVLHMSHIWIIVTHTHNIYVTRVTHMNHSHTACFVYTHKWSNHMSHMNYNHVARVVCTHNSQCSYTHSHTTHMLHMSHIWIIVIKHVLYTHINEVIICHTWIIIMTRILYTNILHNAHIHNHIHTHIQHVCYMCHAYELQLCRTYCTLTHYTTLMYTHRSLLQKSPIKEIQVHSHTTQYSCTHIHTSHMRVLTHIITHIHTYKRHICYMCHASALESYSTYGVATVSSIDKIIGLFCRISSLW